MDAVHFAFIFLPFLCCTRAIEDQFKINCPNRDTNLTLIYQYFQNEVEFDRRTVPKTLDDMTGFSVVFFKYFFSECPTPYTLEHFEHSLEYKDRLHLKNYDFTSMNLFFSEKGTRFTQYQITQPALTVPLCIVYATNSATKVSFQILLEYGLPYAGLTIFGLVIFSIIQRTEIHEASGRNYGDSAWKFVLSPFGLCDEGIMKTPSMKIFTYTWLVIWFLMTGFFWAEMSSNMTVGKLGDEIHSIKDVLTSKRNFFWTHDLKSIPEKALKPLLEKYKTFADSDHKKFETLKIVNESHSETFKKLTTKLLLRDEILLDILPNIPLLLDVEDLNSKGINLVSKKDWSVPINFHVFSSKNNTAVTNALNQLLAKAHAIDLGDLDVEMQKWMGGNAGISSGSNQNGPNIKPIYMMLIILLVGTILTLIVLLIHLFMFEQKERKERKVDVKCSPVSYNNTGSSEHHH